MNGTELREPILDISTLGELRDNNEVMSTYHAGLGIFLLQKVSDFASWCSLSCASFPRSDHTFAQSQDPFPDTNERKNHEKRHAGGFSNRRSRRMAVTDDDRS
jgi:hypothetical protein